MFIYIVMAKGYGALKAFESLDDAKEYANLNSLSIAEMWKNSSLRIENQDREYKVYTDGKCVSNLYVDRIEYRKINREMH